LKRSKSGRWILEDDRYQYMAYIEKAEIVALKAYSPGFQSVEVKVQKYNAKEGRYIEMTWPDYHFRKIAWSTREEVMIFLLKEYRNKKLTDEIKLKLISYEKHLEENFPEMLIKSF